MIKMEDMNCTFSKSEKIPMAEVISSTEHSLYLQLVFACF